MVDPQLLSAVTAVLAPGGVLTGDEVSSRSAGWISRSSLKAAALFRPRTTEELSAVMSLCHAAGQPVVPHGGLTGLVEGGHAEENEVVVSLELMNQIEELDEAAPSMTVQAGVVLETIQKAAQAKGLLFPLDLGARGSAMMGGLISTNAGGNRVIRYGMTRNLILGLEAVLADGTIISSMYPVVKNNSGYDLKQLFVGSEGTLGIVTRAILRLQPQPRSQNTAFLAVNDFGSLPKILNELNAGLGGTLSAFEVMWNEFYRLVTTPPAKQRPPLPQTYPLYVLVDALGSDETTDRERFSAALEGVMDKGLAADCVVALNANERAGIWAMRDDVDQFHQFRPWFGFDVSLPIKHMDEYVKDVRARLSARWSEHKAFVFGHMGDGNLHLNIHVGSGDAESRNGVEEIVYGGLTGRTGAISAEHGVGLEKRAWLRMCRTPEELALMRTLKKALDPKGILNPGKILAE